MSAARKLSVSPPSDSDLPALSAASAPQTRIYTGRLVSSDIQVEDLYPLADGFAAETFSPRAPDDAFPPEAGETRDEQLQFLQADLREHLRAVYEDGDIAVMKVGDRVVGMARVIRVSKGIFEMGKGYMSSEYRGRHFYRELRHAMVEHCLRKYPGVRILTAVRLDSMKHISRSDGWEEIGFAEYLRIHGWTEERIAPVIDAAVKDGWTAFISQ